MGGERPFQRRVGGLDAQGFAHSRGEVCLNGAERHIAVAAFVNPVERLTTAENRAGTGEAVPDGGAGIPCRLVENHALMTAGAVTFPG